MEKPSRTRLSWKQKELILEECKRRSIRGSEKIFLEASHWAYRSLRLHIPPSTLTIRRILGDEENVRKMASSEMNDQKKAVAVMHPVIEHELLEWVMRMWELGVHITDGIIQEKARQISIERRVAGLNRTQYGLNFSNGWLAGFKKRHSLKSHKSHGEIAGADREAARNCLPILRGLVREFGEENMYNADETGLCYRRSPTTTIGPGPLPGKKKAKERVTVLLCCNVSGTDRVPPFVIGRSNRPRSFGGATNDELGFDYASHTRAWMDRELFNLWLLRFNERIANSPQRKVCLLLDNASVHGTINDIPILSNVLYIFYQSVQLP